MKANVGRREQLLRVAIGSAAATAALLLPALGTWRWLLGTWGVANMASAVTRYCPSNHLFGIDNTQGSEFMHFDEALSDARGRIGQRLNELQRQVGARFDDAAVKSVA